MIFFYAFDRDALSLKEDIDV